MDEGLFAPKVTRGLEWHELMPSTTKSNVEKRRNS